MSDLTIIGRAERIDIPDFDIFGVPAKVDTGADSSSVWASDIHLEGDTLCYKLFGQGDKLYTGKEIYVQPPHYKVIRIASSFGHKELRYVVKLRLVVNGRHIKTTITLANRSNKTYPMLLGRRMLAKKFLVDVSVGKPLLRAEARKKKLLEEDMLKLDYRKENS